MAYTATKLITNAYYLSNVVPRRFKTVSGDQISDGLDLLNEIFSMQNLNGETIPFYREYNLTAVAGQEEYTIPGLITWETFTFNIGVVRYACIPQKRKEYRGSSRIDDTQSLPTYYNFERKLNGSLLSLYFVPNTTYPLTIWGKFGLDSVALTDDLTLVYELNYINYLRYFLAKYICHANGAPFSEQSATELKSIGDKMTRFSPPDLSMQKMSAFRSQNSLNYAQVNISPGWTV